MKSGTIREIFWLLPVLSPLLPVVSHFSFVSSWKRSHFSLWFQSSGSPENWPPCYTLYLTHCWKWCLTPINLVTMLYLTYCWKWNQAPIKLATMLCTIPDTLLKVALNTNKTGHHVIRYSWHIVECGVKHQLNWSPCYTWHIFESGIKHQ